MTEDEKLDRVVCGLKPRAKVQVKLQDPLTFEEAVRMVETVDQMLFQSKTNRINTLPQVSTAPSSLYNQLDPMEVDLQTAQLNLPKLSKDLCEECRGNAYASGVASQDTSQENVLRNKKTEGGSHRWPRPREERIVDDYAPSDPMAHRNILKTNSENVASPMNLADYDYQEPMNPSNPNY
ncbi:hypothetical protein K493DRAFT_348067 [Basidiobolus meristosporus CBS 931.73]|uniref:Uncharacterized protein n=1 Tax=Basidiobolus meristosporus CBS 931.73 TaxID=1314790 RepID=A0A1Y1YQ23_9FUNG|nr:hypothetical protein K493DRAFT_348067 [Basidiobolus meristosporus CBS 931.73]|eukprot:ORY00120.1 hypothetical protein K493DRAFT_348067 [Basidiobolus meristosporus CBS 931.73]